MGSAMSPLGGAARQTKTGYVVVQWKGDDVTTAAHRQEPLALANNEATNTLDKNYFQPGESE